MLRKGGSRRRRRKGYAGRSARRMMALEWVLNEGLGTKVLNGLHIKMTSDLDNLRVVLVATRTPLNIGAAARAMSNFGVRRLRVVNPYEKAFREARSAVGAAGGVAEAGQEHHGAAG